MARCTKEQAQQTKLAILDAAQWCFRTFGVSATSIDLIAERAQCTRGAIYWHFEDRVDLLAAVLARGYIPITDNLAPACDANTAILLALRGCLLKIFNDIQGSEDARDAIEIMLHRCDMARQLTPPIMERWRNDLASVTATLGHILHRAQTRGEIVNAIDCSLYAALIFRMLVGTLKLELINADRLELNDDSMQMLDAIFDLIAVKR